jgi:ubiquinone/menaquinone biosynthesis C-methylase UbiE
MGKDLDKRFHGAAQRLLSPERLALLQVPEVVRLSLEGAVIRSVLDAGTGTGIFAAAFAAQGLQVTGIDVNEELLLVARAAVKGVDFREAALEKLPCAERAYDLVFLGHVLHETADPLRALREARRVAAARVAILEWPYRVEGQGPPLRHRLPAKKIGRLAVEAGYSSVERLRLKHMDLYRLAP